MTYFVRRDPPLLRFGEDGEGIRGRWQVVGSWSGAMPPSRRWCSAFRQRDLRRRELDRPSRDHVSGVVRVAALRMGGEGNERKRQKSRNFVPCDRESITGHIVGRFAPALHLQQPCIAQHAQFRARLHGVISGKLPLL